ncbi:MAG: ribonuclease H-like YkuK family protein [Candidatus Liptonbacteria bacterium]|nr:ribonuclease H-like YkuK family protein [Candidatus Liptonbacteria bacterium]
MPEFLNSSFGLKLTAAQAVQEIVRFMRTEPLFRYKVTIGTDSQRLSDTRADFVTAVVVHRVGNGGRYFWRRIELGNLHTLRDRILREVVLSLEIATGVVKELQQYSLPEFDFEIHIDVGENGPTKVMLQEVVGMVRAYNFEAKTKPDSYAASSVADHLV